MTFSPDKRPESSTLEKPWSRTVLQAALHYGGSALALLLLFHFLPGKKVWQTLSTLPARIWILVLVGYLATHCLGVGKWRLMVNTAGAGLNYLQAARCYSAGLFGSLFLPSLIGGDLLRAALALRYGKTKAGVLLGSFLDRIVDFAGLSILAAAGALLVPGALRPDSRRVFMWLAAGAVVAVAVGAIAVASIPIRRLSYRMQRRAASLRRAGRSMARRPHAVAVALGISVTAQICFILLNIELADACGLHLRLRAWLFAWPLAKISAAIPITQGGIGVREAALAGLLAPFGAPAVLTVAAGLAWEAVVISGGIISGLFSLLAGRISAKTA